jgi:hypothetical protein
MALRDSQFGRFGAEARDLLGIPRPSDIPPSVVDFQSARLLGNESPASGCGLTSGDRLAQRGYLPHEDQRCLRWRTTTFPHLLQNKNAEIEMLASNHQRCEPVCAHEFVPSTDHKPLYGWFDLDRLTAFCPDRVTEINNVEPDKSGAAAPGDWRPSPAQPFGVSRMLWVLDEGGEIIVGPEAFGHTKHPSLACGQRVWAAGEIGFENGKVRVANLKTGHYLGRRPVGYKGILRDFVNQVFNEYNNVFLNGRGLYNFDTREY